ncbi:MULTISPECIES: ABC transporter ATP-binding protein [Pseudanabaena]|jgi:ATP-binding cassette, subfamily B, multidrug efflux pump|uniref:ABC transporter ATP-binding protein n=1 Tax=Pseudanabaena TaxID=1152 RepID=UPI002478EC5A|nr:MULTISPECIES: ABC transporter ATP-binding protein [Pseudanabaena]MEA5490080.1 ABC transporter ATP-binding protein [Pseudanabaena sp. CCNP1317]WGS73393.1 ABC transporter ATP-binding protein [Pseudanabaena galeata CCNP1313]
MARSQFKNLTNYLRPFWSDLAIGTVALLLANMLGTYIPWLIRVSVDDLSKIQAMDSQNLMHYVWLIIGLSSLMWVIRMVSRVWIFGIGRKIEYSLKQQIFEHLLKLPPTYFANNSAGETISIVTSDVENIRRLMGFALLSIINSVFVYSLTLPAMIAIDPMLTLLSVSVYPIMLVIVQRFSGQLRDEQLEVQEELSNVSSLLQEDLNGMALIKTYAQEENERGAFGKLNDRLLDANLRMARSRNILFPLLGGIASISFLVLIWFGGEKLANPVNTTFKIGDLLTLIIYVERLIFPTAILGFVMVTYQRGLVSIGRIQGILDMPPAITDQSDAIALNKEKVTGKIEAHDLTFIYAGASQPALNNVNFTIYPSETIAILGTIGSGKSTLASALMRLVEVPSNQIFIDGIDITKMRIEDLRAIISFVPQDSFLFSATMRDNIRYGKPQAFDHEVENFANQARIEQEILKFPKQYDTLVGERGITLSGGQRQRTALARALLVDTPILVLDDALSSVDNQTATGILGNFPANKTVLFITHNLSAASTCDRIMLMDAGKIVQVGTHAELLAESQLYQKLWNQHKLETAIK